MLDSTLPDKRCPRCTERVPEDAKKCRYCGTFLEEVSLPVTASYSQTPQSITLPDVAMMSNGAAAIYKRYRDAYLVSRATISIGKTFKTVGLVTAVLIFIMAAIIATAANSHLPLLLEGTFVALATGGHCYIIGVLVSALGHILKAVLDGAVNSSPFLTDEQRMRIMSLAGA